MIFSYVTKGGAIVNRNFRIGQAPEFIEVDGERAERYWKKVAAVPPTAGWPMVCFASGVHASQADQLRNYFKNVGVPTEVTADGDPIYRSAAHRRKALQARGFFDRMSYN